MMPGMVQTVNLFGDRRAGLMEVVVRAVRLLLGRWHGCLPHPASLAARRSAQFLDGKALALS